MPGGMSPSPLHLAMAVSHDSPETSEKHHPIQSNSGSKSTTATAPSALFSISRQGSSSERDFEEGPRHQGEGREGPLMEVVVEAVGDVNDKAGAATQTTTNSSGLGQELEGAVQELLSFDGAEQLLRSAPLDVVLAGGGRIFASSRGTEETYSLSSETDHIGYFISHNWTVHRVIKFLALAFKFNLKDALAVCILIILLCLATGWLGLQPAFNTVDQDYDVAVGCRILLAPLVILTMFFGRCCHRRGSGPSIFLDKVCIHQADRTLQRAGIRKLGAFMRVSDRMLVLYSSVYLKRLWTVYEVASFITLHNVDQLELVPIVLPMAFFMVLAGHMSFQFLTLGVQLLNLPGWTIWLANLAGASVFYAAQRLWAKSRADTKESLENFSVKDAICAVESDRQIVQGNIVALMKASRRVRKRATMAEALEAFDADVRENVAHQFNRIFGHFAFSYSEYLLLALTVLTPTYVDEWSSFLASDLAFREFLGAHALNIFWIFTGLTVWQLATEVLASWFVHLNGWRELAWDVASNTFLVVLGNSALELTTWINDRARTDDILLGCLLGGQVVTTLLTVWLVPKVCSQHRRHSKTIGSESSSRISVGHVTSNDTSVCSVSSPVETSIALDEGNLSCFDSPAGDENNNTSVGVVEDDPTIDLEGNHPQHYRYYSDDDEEESEDNFSEDHWEKRTSTADVADYTLNGRAAEVATI